MAAYMILAGRTNSEIALAAGVVPQTVCILKAQRWFQELLATLANVQGQEVMAVVQGEALASVQKLVELRDGEDVSQRIQLTAALALLEHATGKPTQKIVSISSTTTFSSEKEELENIQAELQALRNQNPQA